MTCRPPEDDAAHAEPLWFLRINPLRRSRLSEPFLRGLLAELSGVETTMRVAADRCSDELYELIGAAADDSARKQLVALRRAIHNDRDPQTTQAPTPAVDQWLTARQRREALRAEIARTYPQTAERERATLARLLDDEDLRCALALVAPEVYQESERYRATVSGGAQLSARTRKSERGLIQYVTRAMVRTSPLSRFTAVGIAVPDDDGVAPGDVRFDQAAVFSGLDRVMLGYALGGLHSPDGDGLLDAWVGLPPTSALDAEAGKLFFLRPTDAGIQRLAAPLTGPIRLLLDATGMGPRPVRSVLSHLVGRSGCSAADALNVVQGAVRQGILCTFNEAEDGSVDLQTMLTASDSPAAELLADVKVTLPRLETAPAAERGEELTRLRSALATVSHLARRPAQIMVEEDYVIPPMRVATGEWRRPLADLGAAVELLSVFDWLHDVRALMTAAFVQRFGTGANVPLAEHADFLVGEVSRRALTMETVYAHGDATDNSALAGIGPPDGCLEGLYAVRRQVTEALHADLTKSVAADGDEVVISAADAAELTAGMPERFQRDPLSYGVLVQQWRDQLIVNDGLPGHGMLYARFLDADRRLGGRALPYLAKRLAAQYGWDGSRVVEDLGLHRLNVNAHAPVLPNGLRPDDWFSLRLTHDPDTDTLRVTDAEGGPLRVLPLGTGHPGLFPPPLSVASGLVISGRLYNGLVNSWHAASPWDRRETRTCPRMSVGAVMIARRRWYGGDELDRAVAAGPDEHDRLLALTAWRGRHDVPEEVVIKTAPDDDGPLSVSAPEVKSRRLQQKPQYVDLTSALSVRVLPRMLDRRQSDGSGTGYLEEALPGVVDGTHAAEWVVEVGRRPGGRFRYGGEIG
jgi:hypothetical protein